MTAGLPCLALGKVTQPKMARGDSLPQVPRSLLSDSSLAHHRNTATTAQRRLSASRERRDLLDRDSLDLRL